MRSGWAFWEPASQRSCHDVGEQRGRWIVLGPDLRCPAWLRGIAHHEAAILTLVIAVTGALVVQSPEGNAGQQQQTPAASSTFSTPFGQHDVTVTITPAASGENIIDFTLLDHAGQPISMQRLPELAARLPAAELGPLAGKVKSDSQPGHFRATVNLPISGQWQVAIRARVSKFEEPAAHLTATIR